MVTLIEQESDIMEQAWQKIYQTACSGVDINPLEEEITSSLFEEIAFTYLHPQLKEKGCFLLNPVDTHQLYRQLYPEQIPVYRYHLSERLPGITIPDGLIFLKGKNTHQLIGICEYTLSYNLKDNQQKLAQLQRYLCPKIMAQSLKVPFPPRFTPNICNSELGLLLNIVNPQISPFPVCRSRYWKVIMVTPQDSVCPWPVEKVLLPFSGSQFKDHVHTWLGQKLEDAFPEGYSCQNLAA